MLELVYDGIEELNSIFFADSGDVMLRYDVLSMLQHSHARETQQTPRRLGDDYPDDDSIFQLIVLVGALDLRSTASFSNHQVAAEARCALVEATTAAALRMWGEHASIKWLPPLWRELARRAASLPFRADSIDTHAAVIRLQAGGWSDGASSAGTART
jgi:hypothetical protein